jgi:hypothetical protein
VTGTWLQENSGSPPAYAVLTCSPEDPSTGRLVVTSRLINQDPTFDGLAPGATSVTPFTGTAVRTGPNSWQGKDIAYVLKDAKPNPVVLMILVVDDSCTITASDELERSGTFSCYLPTQDKDGDGLPDPGEKPVFSVPTAGHSKRL